MDIKYKYYKGIPEADVLKGILNLHIRIFGSSDDLLNKMKGKSNLLLNIALENTKVVGYKIGYELDSEKFYSWLGGVDKDYRKYGIASSLMVEQHNLIKEIGYKIVQTKTMNKWRGMLVLNIKSGFNVIETYTDEKGFHKIILEKELLN